MNIGVLYAAVAYTCWGLFPAFFKQLGHVNPLEVVMHRMLWSLVFLMGVLALLRRWAWLRDVMRQPRVLAAFALSALLLSANWSVYVWAVQNAQVVDASLGYFILPLVNVGFGFRLFARAPASGCSGLRLLWPLRVWFGSRCRPAGCLGLRWCWQPHSGFMACCARWLRLARWRA
jgi:chloramphenicol-sensitive protein RarD